MADGISASETSAAASPPRWKKPAVRVVGTERRVRHYQISTNEILGLSVLNPIGAVILGWGVNLTCTWATMASDNPHKVTMGITAVGVLIVGGVIQLASWGALFLIWLQSRPRMKKPGLLGQLLEKLVGEPA